MCKIYKNCIIFGESDESINLLITKHKKLAQKELYTKNYTKG